MPAFCLGNTTTIQLTWSWKRGFRETGIKRNESEPETLPHVSNPITPKEVNPVNLNPTNKTSSFQTNPKTPQPDEPHQVGNDQHTWNFHQGWVFPSQPCNIGACPTRHILQLPN